MKAGVAEPSGDLVLHGVAEVEVVPSSQVPGIREEQDPHLRLERRYLIVVQARREDSVELQWVHAAAEQEKRSRDTLGRR